MPHWPAASHLHVGAHGWVLQLHWGLEPALAEGSGRGGSSDRRSLALCFQLLFCSSARRCFKNKRKEEGRTGWAAFRRTGSRQQGSAGTKGTGSRSGLQLGACSVGVRGGQSCEFPLYTGRTSPHPLCRAVAASPGRALGQGHLSPCRPGPQADSALPCWSKPGVVAPASEVSTKSHAPDGRAELPGHRHPAVEVGAGACGLLKAGAALARRRW